MYESNVWLHVLLYNYINKLTSTAATTSTLITLLTCWYQGYVGYTVEHSYPVQRRIWYCGSETDRLDTNQFFENVENIIIIICLDIPFRYFLCPQNL